MPGMPGMAPPNPGPAPAGAPAGGMMPGAGASDAQAKSAIVQNLNIATQAGVEAVEAAKAAPSVNEQTAMKIAKGVSLIAEASEEVQAVAAPAADPQATMGTGEGGGPRPTRTA